MRATRTMRNAVLSLMTVGWLMVPVASFPAIAASSCIFSWAVPGTYRISGDFRGTVEAASAKLTRDCRVIFQVPGVFSGGPVSRSGSCLRFSFKVEGERQVFSAKWCNNYGIVPWQGRNIRAEVTRIRIEAPDTPQRRNFNVN